MSCVFQYSTNSIYRFTVPKYVSQVLNSDNFTFTCSVCIDKLQLNLTYELSDKIENIKRIIKQTSNTNNTTNKS